jgi:Xaa-Pro aminopeptidase
MEDQRIIKPCAKLNELKIDALLVSNFYNILYLTGFKTLTDNERAAWILVTKNNNYLFTDGRYLNKNYKLRITDYELKLIEPGRSVLSHLRQIIKKEKIKKLGVEGEDLKLSEYERLKKTLPDINIVSTEKLIIKLREIKDGGEIDKIKKAGEIADRCLKEVIKTIKVGMAEKELAFKIEFWLKENGYNIAFDPIVAIDKNSAIPHYATKDGQGRIREGSVVLIDFGAKYQDYVSDITRMVFINPKAQTIKIYHALLTIQEKTITTLVRPHQSCTDIDQACRKLITNCQLPNYPHSTGHGVGLEIHEYPKISQTSTDEIKFGQVFTIEPGVYFEGKWGIRIEDTVYINNRLQPKTLTKFSKQPLIIKS